MKIEKRKNKKKRWRQMRNRRKHDRKMSSLSAQNMSFSPFGAWSVSKNEKDTINEDSARADSVLAAVSDGAGGGGVFAEKWSKTLLDNLPDAPIRDAKTLDNWLDGFANEFYDQCEALAKEKGGLFLDKFYEEGSFATLSVVWKTSSSTCQWMMYGDSTVFCYNFATNELSSSIVSLSQYDEPPFLISTISPTDERGVITGAFEGLDANCIVFVCSDALSHFLLMLYQLEHSEQYELSINASLESHTKTSNFTKMAKQLGRSFEKVLNTLLSSKSNDAFAEYLYSCEKDGVLGHDDYSFAYLKM